MKILPGVKEIWSVHRIKGSNSWHSIMTLTLSRHGLLWVLHIIEANIWPKFDKDSFRGKGDMERTRNTRLKLVTFNYELDLESGWLCNGICTNRELHDIPCFWYLTLGKNKSGSAGSLTFVSARFSVRYCANGYPFNIFCSQHGLVVEEISGQETRLSLKEDLRYFSII